MYQLDSKKYWSDPCVPVHFEFRDPQSPFPLHQHDFHEIVFIYSGKATHLTAHGDYEITGGDCLNIKPGQAHGYKNIRSLALMNVLIRPSFFRDDHFGVCPAVYDALFGPRGEEDGGESPVTRFHPDFGTFSRAKNLIENAGAELRERPAGYGVMVTCLIQELMILLLRGFREQSGSPAGFASDVRALFSYVKDHYRAALNMDTLTGVSGMSQSGVRRAFKRHLGCAPFQYVNRLRLAEAADALIQTDKPIIQIAMDLGFNDSNYFTRSFRKQTGLSPREYRAKYFIENLL
jgi:AraC-like DNA-binding protein